MADMRKANKEYVSIPEFYKNRSIFITGGTGFIGKVLIEKLLRSCPGISNIYLLIRPKKMTDINVRLRDMLEAPLFDKLRNEDPEQFEKLVPLEGDMMLPDLGMSRRDQRLLFDKVSVVFHSAATVNFEETLQSSIRSNIIGTKLVAELSTMMRELKAFVHVSTAYCNCDRTTVEEVLYDVPWTDEQLIYMAETMEPEFLEKITPIILAQRPNTYTFTKAVTENLLLKNTNIPVVVVRPSIVMACVKEPLPGWQENWKGPTGLIGAAYKGVFRTMNCKKNNVADVVPVDIVVNSLIAAGWRRGTVADCKTIYHCTTGQHNPITWGCLSDTCLKYVCKHPLNDTLWYTAGCYYNSTLYDKLLVATTHYFPAYLVDKILKTYGQESNMLRMVRKIRTASFILQYFTRREWNFKTDNYLELNSSMSQNDKDVFNLSVCSFTWETYLEQYVLGIRKHLYKQKITTLPIARQRLKKLYWIKHTFQLASLLTLWIMCFSRFKRFRTLCFLLVDLVVRTLRMIPYPSF